MISLEPFVILPAVYYLKQHDLTDPNVIFYIRCFFGTVHAILILGYIMVAMRLRSVYNQSKIRIPKELSLSDKLAGKTEEQEEEEMTIFDYDAGQLKQQFRTILLLICFGLFLHLYAGFVPPLVVQSLVNTMGFFKHPLVKIYFMNQQVTRPFPKEKTLAEAFAQPEANKDSSADKPAGDETKKQSKSRQHVEKSQTFQVDEPLAASADASDATSTRKRVARRKE
eukprot:TRINITY_DN624_c0_g2_i1.p1 TRINITY_DN624_c0_g2~~TRINITY_DN624_c0_g2_i1.p1  ORF type:complete len:225 (+),score=64.67 TRINITY_DN624_c0_g2_i1:48-722(+)